MERREFNKWRKREETCRLHPLGGFRAMPGPLAQSLTNRLPIPLNARFSDLVALPKYHGAWVAVEQGFQGYARSAFEELLARSERIDQRTRQILEYQDRPLKLLGDDESIVMDEARAQLVEIPPLLAESISQFYDAVIANLDRTPWSHHGSGEKIPASQVAVPARVIKQVTERERRERKEREDDERRRVDPEVAVFYEEPRLDRDHEEVTWEIERSNLTRAVLKGAPGGGKTFLAQITALDLARKGQQQLSRAEDLDRLPLPIMMELKELESDTLPKDLATALLEVLAVHYPASGPLKA